MKLWKKLLVAINLFLASLVGILTNVFANNFPILPPLILWGGGGAIFIIFIIFSVIVITRSEEKTGEEEARAQKQRSAAKQSSFRKSKNKHKVQHTQQTATTTPFSNAGNTTVVSHPLNSEIGQPTVDTPLLICLAIDVSRSMKKPIIDHTGKAIERWATVKDALEEFLYVGAAWVKDPSTQRVLPLYRLTAYGFGFREVVHGMGMRKTPGGDVRDLLAHPSLPSLPSASDLSEHSDAYKEHLLSWKAYTGDLFGLSPLCQALKTIRDRIKEERKHHHFTTPILLLIISDGLADDGDPLPIIAELQSLDVLTLSCYLADEDVLAPRQLYSAEDPSWTDGARLLFHCASPLHKDTYVSHALFDYLDDHGWRPSEGAHLFAQVNQAEALGNFLQVLLHASATERSA